jgi:hypothetical protein
LRKLTAVIGSALVLTGISGGNAWATEDLPVIDASSGQLSSSNLYRGDTLSFSVRITDDVGCCSWVGWGVYTSPGMNVNSGEILWTLNNNSPSSYRISGDQLDGRYAYSLVIPNDIAFGTYYLKVQANDNAGGYTHLDQIGSFTVSERPGNSGANSSTSPPAGPTTTSPATTSPTPAPTVSRNPSSSPTPSTSESPESSSDEVDLRSNEQNSVTSKVETDSAGIFIGIAGSVTLGVALGISYAYLRQKQGKPLLPIAQKQVKALKPKPRKSKR